MEVLSALLCDSASDYEGKLCVLGAFDTIVAPSFPVIHPTCSVALRMLFRHGDEGSHRFAINLIDYDGKNLLPEWTHDLEIDLPPDMYFRSVNLVCTLQSLPIAAMGQYAFDVSMDRNIIARIPLQVMKSDDDEVPS